MQVFPPPGPPELGAIELQSLVVLVQLVLQLAVAASHWKVPQVTGAPGVQVPLPLQLPTGIAASDCETVAPLSVPDTGGAHAAAPQLVPVFVSSQPLLPSHLPVLPQGGLAKQLVVSRAVPLAAMLVQVPALPETTQL
jgi:hypothetical protein